MRIQNNFHINGCALCLAKWLIRCILILHIYGRFFVRNKINCKNSSFSFLSRVCSRSYHLRDDRQIFCYEFLRRYICVLCRVVPYSGEVRGFLQPPPRHLPQGLLVFLTRKSWGRGVFQSTQTRVQRSFPRGGERNSKSATPDLFFTQQGCQ